ncbi:MAG: hypothetical protein HETSPECPRED_006275 [Heterodermia speciosa]|uniref:Uncharacterized protein n=1 Tax=Heterodermia speciosa TaxID=116794 RepID=A0A8H3PJJ0_9LECA|nr:MAG: hypothetical protein HETSPECPRED_006275 [Heterodermia speciosa]
MRLEARGTRRSIRNIQAQKITTGSKGGESKPPPGEAPYNEEVPSEKTGQKRKRKVYKSQPGQSTPSEPQNQPEPSIKPKPSLKPLQIPLKAINVKQQNVQVSQISAAELTARLRIIRYLYEKHSGAEFPHTVRDIYEAVINHSGNTNSDTESYTYCSSSPKSVEPSIIGSLSIPSTPDSYDLFRLTVRTPSPEHNGTGIGESTT